MSSANESDPAASHDVSARDPDPIDLNRIEEDLADVEAALVRLDNGQYWSDEVSGEELPDTLLAERPTARRVGG